MTALAVVVTIDPEGQLPDQLLRAFQGLCIVIKVQFVLLLRSLRLEGGEKALHHRVISATALGRHAAADLVALPQLPVGYGPILATLIGVD